MHNNIMTVVVVVTERISTFTKNRNPPAEVNSESWFSSQQLSSRTTGILKILRCRQSVVVEQGEKEKFHPRSILLNIHFCIVAGFLLKA